MPKSITFSQLDYEELAAHLVGYSEDDEYEMEEVENRLIEMHNLDLSYFIQLMTKLGDLLDMSVSPLTEEPFIGFGTGRFWIAKKSFPKFINAVLVWMSAEEVRASKGSVFERLITSGGKPEFKLVLMKADQEYTVGEQERALIKSIGSILRDRKEILIHTDSDLGAEILALTGKEVSNG